MERYIEMSERDNMKMLMDEVDELFSEIRKKMFDSHVKSFTNSAEGIPERYKERRASGDLTNKRGETQSFHNYISGSPYRKLYKKGEVQGYYGKNIETIPELIPDYKKVINQMAKETVESYIETYKGRLSAKMAMILKSKRLTNIELLKVFFRGQIHAVFQFSFEEGQFEVVSQVVFVVNQYGTAFSRFPYTFHNVKYPDGKVKKKDSLENIERGFLYKDLGDVGDIRKAEKEKKKALAQNQRKLKSQVMKACGIIDHTKDPEIVKVGFQIILEDRNRKWIESFELNNKIKRTISSMGSGEYDIKPNTIVHIKYKDGTDIKFKLNRILGGSYNKSDKLWSKIKGNLDFGFSYMYGEITEVINQGYLSKEVQ